MPFDRSAPGVRLTLLPDEKAASGASLDLADRLVGLTYEDTDEKADKLSLQLDNFDLSLFERIDLLTGAVLEVSWGYPCAMSPPRRVVIQSMKGFSTLTLEGVALSAFMNKVVRTRRWEHHTRAEVVRKVAAEQGYEHTLADIEDTKVVLDVVCQTAETDAWFLKRLAAKEGFDFYVDGTGLHWHRRRQEAPPSRVLTWYGGVGELLSVSVESNLQKRVGEVELKGRDPLDKTTITASATSDTAKRATLGDFIEVVDPKTGTTKLLKRNATSTSGPTAAGSKGLIDKEAEAKFVKAEREAVKLTLSVVGDPTLAAKTVIEVEGISSLLSGKYYVKEVKHQLGTSGYICELKVTRDGKGGAGGAGAASTKPQGGDKNTAGPKKAGAKKPIEVIDPKTGKSRIEWRDDGAGSADPEAKK